MRILQICHKPPFPDVDGGTKAEKMLTELLIEAGHQIDVFTIATEKHPFLENEVPNWFSSQGKIEYCQLKAMPNKIGAITTIFKDESYILSRFKSEVLKQQLLKIDFQQYETIVFDGLASALFLDDIKQKSGKKIILRTHNIEFLVWQNLKKEVKNPIKSTYFGIQSKKLEKQELNLFKSADEIWHLNQEEINDFPNELKQKVHFVPITLKLKKIPKLKSNTHFKIGFMGAANWQPNAEAFKFIQSKLALLAKENKIETVLAGRFQTSDLLQNPNVTNLGEVKSLEDFYQNIDAFINPIFSGSGLRIKILDAVQFMVPIVSSKKGIEGLGLEANVDYLPAENVNEFLNQILWLIKNQEKAKGLAQSAYQKIETNFGIAQNISLINNLLIK